MSAKSMEKFRELGQNELEIQEHELGEQIFRLRFQLTTGQAESVKKLREARKDLARVKTLVRQRALGLASAGPQKAAGDGNPEKKRVKARAEEREKKPKKEK